MRRYALRDDQWDRIKDFLPGREGHVGGTAADNRLFVEAVLYRYRAGIPWRDLPERFGDWKIVHQRFSRWAKSGVFERIFKMLASDHDNEYMMIDALGNPVDWILTPGQGPRSGLRRTADRQRRSKCLDWRQGLRCRSVHRWPHPAGNHPGDPPKNQSQDPAALRFRAVLRTEPGRTLLQQTQAFSSHRHTLRQTRQKFPGRSSTGLRNHPAQLNTGPRIDIKTLDC